MKTRNDLYRTGPVARPRWMIVDDNQDILALMSTLLTPLCDAEVEYYRSPQDALSAFESVAGSYELVITDLEMPGMSGIELGRRLHGLAPKTRILLATGCEVLTETEAREMGFCGLLRKPFSAEKLHGWLQSARSGKVFRHFSTGTAVLTPV